MSITLKNRDVRLLYILSTNLKGLHASEVSDLSKGFITRGNVYNLLKKLTVVDMVSKNEDKGSTRPFYKLAPKGRKSLKELLDSEPQFKETLQLAYG